jgi:glycosyltransferase involved in cell wall biosynthesis
MMRAIIDVIRGEGLASAITRTRERVAESLHDAASRFGTSRIVKTPILNDCATSIAPRNGGVGIQLTTRLRAERRIRDVALLHPGGLLINDRLHRVYDIPEALAITGARAIHIEGMHAVPIDEVLRLIDDGIRVIVTLHDFALLCEHPHLIERSTSRFCDYSRDVDRCARCHGDQSQRRALARTLLTSAAGVIFPSHFLFDRHREFFSLPDLAAEVIEPPVPLTPFVRNTAHREIAYVGSVKAHKGGHLLPEIARALAARNTTLHVFGGGDRQLLQPLRKHSNVVIHGYYRGATLPSLLARHRVGLVLLASIWPETFSLTLSEAWLAGACVAAFDLGAIAERVHRDGGGWLAPLESGASGLIAIIERWLSGAACTPPTRALPSAEDAANGHMDLYRKLRL